MGRSLSIGAQQLTLTSEILKAIEQGMVLIATDFDGTISQLVAHPEDARGESRAVEALNRLSAVDDIGVAVVSGRAHADLKRLLPSSHGWTLIGEHGNDLGEETRDDRVERLAEAVGEIAGRLDGSHVETKPHSVAFHWRDAREDPESAISEVRSLNIDGGRVLNGKKVIEFTFGKSTKADAVLSLSERYDSVVFIGDDVTDEDAFAALGSGGITVKVGEGETSARHRVADVGAVVSLLESLVAGLNLSG